MRIQINERITASTNLPITSPLVQKLGRLYKDQLEAEKKTWVDKFAEKMAKDLPLPLHPKTTVKVLFCNSVEMHKQYYNLQLKGITGYQKTIRFYGELVDEYKLCRWISGDKEKLYHDIIYVVLVDCA